MSVASALVPIVVGFLLTTVVGGLLGVYLQRRSWSHQYNVQLAAAGRDRAVALFEELSRLLDRRLYRMRRLYWTLSGARTSAVGEGREESGGLRRRSLRMERQHQPQLSFARAALRISDAQAVR
jgi:hypothetical protein